MSERIVPTIKKISKQRFDAFVMLTREPLAGVLAQEIDWYSDDEEKVLGALFEDRTDQDYCYVLLARDESGKFRAIDLACSFISPARALERP